jgi:hypothetical protein
MNLHPDPEPTTFVIVPQRVEVPRCPIKKMNGEQCPISGSYDIVVNEKRIQVCGAHRNQAAIEQAKRNG